MRKEKFDALLESVKQAGEIARDERAPACEFHVDAALVKALRAKIGLSQPKFAAILHVTIEEAFENAREAISACCELLAEDEKDMPNPRPMSHWFSDKEYRGSTWDIVEKIRVELHDG